jgi:hypothetical protein
VTLTLLHEPRCPACRRLREWIGDEPRYVDVATLEEGDAAVGRRFPGLDLSVEHEGPTVVGERGEVWRGEKAVRVCLWALRRHRDRALRGPVPSPGWHRVPRPRPESAAEEAVPLGHAPSAPACRPARSAAPLPSPGEGILATALRAAGNLVLAMFLGIAGFLVLVVVAVLLGALLQSDGVVVPLAGGFVVVLLLAIAWAAGTRETRGRAGRARVGPRADGDAGYHGRMAASPPAAPASGTGP